MSGTNIAPGFGGFAVTPDGQAQYMARMHNPYSFLQQDQLAALGMAPAASDAMLARGGNVGITPQEEMQWARFLRPRATGGFRRGGLVGYRRFDDGGDTGGGDDGSDAGAAGGTNGGFGGADAPGNEAASGASSGDGSSSGMSGGLGGMTAGLGAANAVGAAAQGVASQQQGADPSIAQTLFTGAKSGLMGMVPGFGLLDSVLGLSGKAANALGIVPESKGAQVGSGIGGLLGGIFGGPPGAIAGSMLGGYAGAHGTNSVAGQDPGIQGGAGSDGGYMPMAQGPGQPDLSGEIQRIKAAMASGTQSGTQQAPVAGLARGGRVPNAANANMPNHDFQRGSGLIHGSSDGRADALHAHVPQGGYVIPADVVSGLGQGNTLSGARRIRGMIPGNVQHFATGGSVPVRLSAGEFFVHPAHVAALGGGSHQSGSDKLDEMIGHVRRIAVNQMTHMPPPR